MKKEREGKKEVDEFSLCASLAKLVNAQKQEIELAAVEKGEYKQKYKFLQISEDKWSRIQENQREKAVEKLHTVKIEEASGPNIVKINNIVTIQDDPVMQQMLCGGID